MLSDPQIERYCRQIVLPEVGSRGQERLLGACVSIAGGGDAALVCAAYLAGAGVGRIALAAAAERRSALTALIQDRNPDCTVLETPPASPDAALEVGPVPARFLWPAGTIVLWAVAAGDGLVRVRFARGRACAGCLRHAVAAPEESSPAIAEPLLGAVLAADCLRAILGLADPDEAQILRIDLGRMSVASGPFHYRPKCAECSAA